MSRIKMPTFSVRYDEQQLLDIAAKARVQSSKKSYLHKSDPKLKKLTQRWCCVFQNMLFYFESESVTKPLGVVMLEGCQCKAVEQIGQSTATEVRVLAACNIHLVESEMDILHCREHSISVVVKDSIGNLTTS